MLETDVVERRVVVDGRRWKELFRNWPPGEGALATLGDKPRTVPKLLATSCRYFSELLETH